MALAFLGQGKEVKVLLMVIESLIICISTQFLVFAEQAVDNFAGDR